MITLCVIAACFYWGILYENVTILICGVALGILLLLSVLEVLYRLFTIKCHLEIPISMADRNKPVSIGIRVDNRSGITCGKVKFRLSIHNTLESKGKKHWITLQNVYSDNLRYDVPILITAAGCQEVEIRKMRIYAFTGLVYLTKPCKEFGSIIVMPQIHSVGVRISEAVRNFIGDADVYDEYRPGHDPTELFEIREYREKDKLQSIHWKLSAKMDELTVREHSLPSACGVVLLLDTGKEKHSKRKRKEKSMDQFLELAASLSYTLMDEGCPHYIAWFSKQKGEITRIRVDDEESFYLFLSVFLQDSTITDKCHIKESYMEKYRREYYLCDLLINPYLEIYKNGNKITDESKTLEIIL
jgi:uncharacterized protein (DUF58 family)